MGLFDFFKPRSPLTGDELREQLITAVEDQDWKGLSRLCELNQQTIRKLFSTWQTVPDGIRDDPVAANRYFQGLMNVALLFEKTGDRSLISLLTGDQGDSPIKALERDLSEAQSLIANGLSDQAVKLLTSTLSRIENLRGSGVNHCLSRTFGMLGTALYHSGDAHRAVEFTQRARALCEELGDEGGAHIYAVNLEHMAKGPAEVQKLILRDELGRELLEDDLKTFTGKIKWEIVGGHTIPPEAQELHSLARREGQGGNYDKALELLKKHGHSHQSGPIPSTIWLLPIY